jgi:hypothetical protein
MAIIFGSLFYQTTTVWDAALLGSPLNKHIDKMSGFFHRRTADARSYNENERLFHHHS